MVTSTHRGFTAWLIWACAACAPVITQKNRETARIDYDLGINALERGDQRESLRALLASLREDPYLPEAHHALGLVYHAMGKLDDAYAQYKETLRLRPKFSEASNNLGILLIDMRRYDAAIAAFQTALNDILYATPTLAEGNMGWAYYRKGDVAAGIEHIGNAVATDPQFCRGYEWLMRIALDQKNSDVAVANGRRFYRHCVNNDKINSTLTPDYRAMIDYYLACGLLGRGEPVEARAVLQGCAAATDGTGSAPPYADRCQNALATLR